MTDKLRKRIQLTDKEYKAVKQLYISCERYDKYSARVYWNCVKSRAADVYHDYLLYKRNLLVAYLGVFNFNADDIEVCALVHPLHRRQGIFSNLFETSFKDIKYKKVKNILLPCAQDFEIAKKAVTARGAEYKHSEYTLQIDNLQQLPLDLINKAAEVISVEPTTASDVELVAKLDAICFESPFEEGLLRFKQTLTQPERASYLAKLGDKIIGKIHIHFFENRAFIHDFCIVPELQGKKFGRDLLMQTLSILQQEGRRRVALDVVASNKHAIKLYTDCGFKLIKAYDYWQITPNSSGNQFSER